MIQLDRKLHPEFKQVRHISIPAIERLTLDNGIPVYLLKGGSQEVVKLDLIVGAGSRFSLHKLVAPFTSQMLNEGTSAKSAHEIAESFDYYGAYFQPSTEKDNAFVDLLSLNKHLEKTLPLLVEALSDSIFPEHEMETLIARKRQNFLVECEKTSFLARESFYELLFGALHPYGIKASEEYYNELTRSILVDFYQKNYHAGNYKLLLSGMITDKEIRAINGLLGQLPVKTVIPDLLPETIEQPASFFKVIEKNGAVQSSIRTGILTIGKDHPDYLGLKVLTSILGGYFGSRLMKNIREDKGYSYGIHAMQVALQQTGYMAIAADVKAEFTRQAVEEIKKEIERLRNELVTTEELNLVRNFMMGDMLQLFDGPLATSEAIKAIIQYDVDVSYFKLMQETILTITPADLQRLAQLYFKPDQFVTVVSGIY